MTPPIAGGPAFGPPGMPPPSGNTVSLQANPGGGSKSHKGRAIAIVVAAIAVLVVAVVAVKSIGGDDAASGGADSPEQATTEFIEALRSEDPLALVDLIEPKEASLARDGVQQFLDIVSGKDTTSAAGEAYDKEGFGKLDLNDLIPGFTAEVSNVQVESEELGPNFAKVRLQGIDVDWKFDAGEFSDTVDLSKLNDEGVEVQDASGSFDESDIQNLYGGSDSKIDAPFLVTTKISGRWYVSIELTALEAVRTVEDLQDADWGDLGPTKNFGADSPGEAIKDLITAVAKGRTSDIIEALPPEKYEALYRFRNSFADFDPNVTIKMDIPEGDVIKDDRGTVLPLDGSSITLSQVDTTYGDKDTFTILFDKDCFTYTEQKYDSYYDETTNSKGGKCWSDLGDLADSVDSSTIDLSWLKDIPDIDGFWVNVTQQDGRWFVDPIDTITAYGDIIASAQQGG